MSELIILQEGQSGYDIVAEYVIKYWDKTYYSTAIVSLETSHDGIIYNRQNEVVIPSCGDFVEFLHDWWEGQKFIKINGVKNIDEIEFVPTSDVVEVVRCKDCEYSTEDHEDGYACDLGIILGYQRGNDYCGYGKRREE